MSELGARDSLARSYGAYAMYDVGKLLIAGGAQPATNSAVVVDINGSTPSTTATGSMAHARRHGNLTILADGSVLATGGYGGDLYTDVSDHTAVMPAERWNPATGTWSTMASMQRHRVYHSIAILLPDGRVAAGGGGMPFLTGYNQQNIEIFSPPYLFRQGGFVAKAGVSGSVACNNDAFGDPALGVVKACRYVVTNTGMPMPSASMPAGAQACAVENGTCTLPAGITATVYYGANGVYANRIATGSVACNNATFGDPLYGVVKACSYVDSSMPAQATAPCAAENGRCTLPAGVTTTVYYGAAGRFASKDGVSGGIACDNATFGDPIFGTAKSCSYAIAGTATTPTPVQSVPANAQACAVESGTCMLPAGAVATVYYGAASGPAARPAIQYAPDSVGYGNGFTVKVDHPSPDRQGAPDQAGRGHACQQPGAAARAADVHGQRRGTEGRGTGQSERRAAGLLHAVRGRRQGRALDLENGPGAAVLGRGPGLATDRQGRGDRARCVGRGRHGADDGRCRTAGAGQVLGTVAHRWRPLQARVARQRPGAVGAGWFDAERRAGAGPARRFRHEPAVEPGAQQPRLLHAAGPPQRPGASRRRRQYRRRRDAGAAGARRHARAQRRVDHRAGRLSASGRRAERQGCGIAGQSTAAGAAVEIAPHTGDTSQAFRFVPQSDGYLSIEAAHSGGVVGVAGGSTQPITPLQQQAWSGAASQQWALQPQKDGSFMLQLRHSGQFMNVLYDRTDTGSPIGQYIDNGGLPNQYWRLIPAVSLDPHQRNASGRAIASGHVSFDGWLPYVAASNTIGQTDTDNTLQAVKISVKGVRSGLQISYRTQAAGGGWGGWAGDNQMAGSTGTSTPIQAFQASLAGTRDGCAIRYRAHAKGAGWQPWAAEGQTAGAATPGLPVSALQVFVECTTRTAVYTP